MAWLKKENKALLAENKRLQHELGREGARRAGL
jgi:hypothetical protein